MKPASLPVPSYMGFFAGVGGSSQSGVYLTQCVCEFTGGSGLGYIFGALYERELIPSVKWGGALYINSKSISANYFEIEDVEVFSESTGNSEFVPVDFEHVSEAVFFSAGIMPYLKITPWKWLFLRTGLAAEFPLSSNVTHTKELTRRTAVLSTGEIGIIKLDDPRCSTTLCELEDNEFPDVVSPVLYFNPSAGLNIPFSGNITFSPLFQYSIPLSNISERGKDFKLNSWLFILELRIKLS